MSVMRRPVLVLAALVLGLAGGATAWVTGSGAGAAVRAAKPSPPGPQPNGVNFTIHTTLDTNFCVEDTVSPVTPASEAIMSQCVVRDNQHWTFADAADGSVVIIGGSAGHCLDFVGKTPSYVSVVPCTFTATERFFYTPDGQIESTTGKKCLEPAQANQNASVSFVKCDASVKAQIFQLGH